MRFQESIIIKGCRTFIIFGTNLKQTKASYLYCASFFTGASLGKYPKYLKRRNFTSLHLQKNVNVKRVMLFSMKI